MKLLEMFSGTGSVGRVARDLGFSGISLDLKNANINTDMLSLLKRIPVRSHLITNRIGCHKQSGRPNYGYEVSPM